MEGTPLPPPGGATVPPPGPDGQAGPDAPTVAAPRRRRWPLVVGIVVLLLGIGIGLQQRQVAASWRDRAEVAASERDDALGRTQALQRQLDEVADSLQVSEGDVVELEDRVRELADEKAQAEDVATTTGVERDTLLALSNAIAGSVTDLDGCVTELFDLLNDAIDAFNRQGSGEQVDVTPLNTQRSRTTDGCNQARRDAADAALQAEQLLR